MPRCILTPTGDGLALSSPYDPMFVAEFKQAVPSAERAWDKASRRWLIKPAAAARVAELCFTYFGERPLVPSVQAASAAPQIRVFRVEYLGACKPRDGGGVSAMGYCEGAWSVIAPEPVLRLWFEGAPKAEPGQPEQPAAPTTYYALLGVTQNADEGAIKSGYKRMARQWHPDACREPDAHERFLAIRDAYNILSDPILRKKYNVGLLFQDRAAETRLNKARVYTPPQDFFRAPLRCGMVLAEATPALGRWSLTKVLAWDDITNDRGEVLVASWDNEREEIVRKWVLA
jgi:hypothetical protein